MTSVRLTPGQAPSGGYALEFYRLDGGVLAGKPTLSANVQGNAATPAENFTDARFAVRLKKPDQSYQPLAPGAIAELGVRSYPTGPRIGVARAEDLSTLVFFWQSPGQLDEDAPADQSLADAGADFAAAAQRLLDGITSGFARTAAGFEPPPPPAIELALVIESDAPCELNITEFNLSCNFVLEAFDSPKEKEVLRFAGRRATTESVSVRLPAAARVETAALKIVESFRPERAASAAGEEAVTDAPPSQKSGVYVGVEKWVAQPFTPPQSLAVNGLSLGLMALTQSTELSVEIQEDWREEPSGKKLFEGSIKLEQTGEHAWVTVLFGDALNLAPQTYWIVSKAARGGALWLARTGDSKILILEKLNEKSAWAEVSRLENLEALHRLFSRSQQAQAGSPQQTSVLSVGTNVVVGVSAEGSTTFDLKSALNTYLAGQSQSAPVSIPLAFTSELPGLITVYPPRVVYDV